MNAPDPIDRVLNETIERGNALLQRRNDITAMVSWNRIREYRKAWPVLRNAIDYIVDLETIQQTRTITTVEGLRTLGPLSVVLYKNDEDGRFQSYVIADDDPALPTLNGTGDVIFNDWAGNYTMAADMPLPVTVLWDNP